MRIVVDAAVPWAREAFASLGEVVLLQGRAIDAAALRGADALVVRTATRVDARLLAGSRVRFVGSATAGIDHIDTRWLASKGIAFASAAGCNATAVVEYVLTALHLVALERERELLSGPIGVVGYGHVGRRLTACLRALGAEVLVHDPPLEALWTTAGGTDLVASERFVDWAELVARARVLTLHVPFSTEGRHPTRHMVGAATLEELRSGTVLVNTSRGGVVDETALQPWLADGGGVAVLDVWEDEPDLRWSLLAPGSGVRLATPHVAGYTLEGKLRATVMIHEALAQFVGRPSSFDGAAVLGPPSALPVLPHTGSTLADCAAVLRICDPIEAIDPSLRALLDRPAGERGVAFDRLRTEYALRRELSHFELPVHGLPAATHTALVELGFAVSPIRDAIVLVAHGSPDPDWGRPLLALRDRVQQEARDWRVELAYLDHLEPSLAELGSRLVDDGITRVLVVSAFLSPGGNHIKRDIPALVAELARTQPQLRVELVPGALGAERDVIEALAHATVRLAAHAR